MVNTTLLQKMVSYANINEEDIVLEVGAGLGFLTKLLSHYCRKVVAVEIDFHLIKILREQLLNFENVELIEGDILGLSGTVFNKVVSTPPYSISSPLLFWILKKNVECAVLTFQKEFAERLTAPIGSRNYGRLSVTAYYQAEIELLDDVPRKMFYPPPNVDSMIVRFRPREPPFQVDNEETFFELVKVLFSQKNKKVRNVIPNYLRKRGIERTNIPKLISSLPFHGERVRRLAPEQLGILANEIFREPSIISMKDQHNYLLKNS